VTGATGFIGSHVVDALLARGLHVRALVRPSSVTASLAGKGVHLVQGDITDRSAVERALEDCDYLFHVAALYTFSSPNPEQVYHANSEGSRVVLGSARHVKRIVYTSTVGALGTHADGTPADENVPVSERDLVGAYKKSKYRAQEIAHRLAQEGYPIVIVNPTAPIGPGDVKPTPTGQMIVDYLNGRMKAYVNTGLNLVAVEDVAEGHVLAAERGRVGERYILGNRNIHLREIFQALGDITGIPAPTLRLPHWIPLLAAGVSTAMGRLRGRAPGLSLEAVRLSRGFMYFNGKKAVAELGLPQSCPIAALERAVQWFRTHAPAGERMLERVSG
jgi:dihydroflavonol-4-reductase